MLAMLVLQGIGKEHSSDGGCVEFLRRELPIVDMTTKRSGRKKPPAPCIRPVNMQGSAIFLHVKNRCISSIIIIHFRTVLTCSSNLNSAIDII